MCNVGVEFFILFHLLKYKVDFGPVWCWVGPHRKLSYELQIPTVPTNAQFY